MPVRSLDSRHRAPTVTLRAAGKVEAEEVLNEAKSGAVSMANTASCDDHSQTEVNTSPATKTTVFSRSDIRMR